MNQLEDFANQLQVQLEGLKTNEINEFNRSATALLSILQEELGANNLPELTRRQVEDIVARVRNRQTAELADWVEDLVDSLKELSKFAYEFEASAILAGSSVQNLSTQRTIAFLWQKVLERPLSSDGGMVEDWIQKLTDVQVTATENLIRKAYSHGMTTQQTLQAYRGTRANGFKDGIVTNVGRANATTIRTVMQHVNSVSRMAVWEENEDIIEGYRIVATLDSRTTDVCRSLDQQTFKVGKGPLPPLHPNCRSTTVPELAPEFEAFRKGMTRSAENGPVPQTMTYYEWLKTQNADLQDSVLGRTRGKLFRDGGLSVVEFSRLQLNRLFEPLTLEEMRKLMPAAFKRAGI